MTEEEKQNIKEQFNDTTYCKIQGNYRSHTSQRNAAYQYDASLLRAFFFYSNLCRLFLGVRIFFFLSLINEIYRIDQVHIVLVHQRSVLGELHQIGSFEKRF